MLSVLAANLLTGLRRSAPLLAATIRAASSVKVLPAAVLWILISHRSQKRPIPNAECSMPNAPVLGTAVDLEH
jgi:hypothetical protein